MFSNPTFKRLTSSDWFIAFSVLFLFLLTNNYTYGWDDQHLEITYLKHLIDPELFAGDYYVEGITQNFTSWLYPILARLITVDQIPAAYLILYLISRFVLFLFAYKLWKHLSGSRLTALACTLSFIILHRTEEFLYRTFSHQEFALAIIMAGIYYLFRNRLLLAAFILGVAVNFHALYSLFPMIYLLSFIFFFQKERKWTTLIQSASMFMAGALPYMALYLPKFFQHRSHIDPSLYKDWVQLYLLACPQNFLFNTTPLSHIFKDIQGTLTALQAYFFLTALFVFNWIFNDEVRRNKHLQGSLIGAVALLVVSFIFTYVYPVRLVLDFNLIRNEQFARFLLYGFTVMYVMRMLPTVNLGRAFMLGLFLGFLGIKDIFSLCVVLFTIGVLQLRDHFEKNGQRNYVTIILNVGLILLGLWLMVTALMQWEILKYRGDRAIGIGVLLIITFLCMKFVIPAQAGIQTRSRWIPAFAEMTSLKFRPLFVFLPIVLMFGLFCKYHYNYLERRKHPTGFWQLQKNWEDMQQFAKANTAKDALFLTPYNMEMGGFRIHSERRVLVCYRDCGIVGFDYLAALEWQKRIKDIEAFKVFITEPIGPAIKNAIAKYKVDYIIFMKYAAVPDNQIIKKIYQNEVFVLYKVMK